MIESPLRHTTVVPFLTVSGDGEKAKLRMATETVSEGVPGAACCPTAGAQPVAGAGPDGLPRFTHAPSAHVQLSSPPEKNLAMSSPPTAIATRAMTATMIHLFFIMF